LNSRQLIIGLALQAAAFLTWWSSARILYMAGWLGVLLVSLPLFVASPFFLMRSGLPLPFRLLLSFWILFFPLYFAGQAAMESWSIRTEVFLIPSGFRGHVKVRFGIPDGAPEEREGSNVVFRVEPDGELRTRVHEPRLKFRDQTRYDRREYYLVDSAGMRMRIEPPVPYELARIPVDKVIVSLAGEHFIGNDVTLYEFYVGAPAEIKKLWEQRN
jgi:hypothetical protein